MSVGEVFRRLHEAPGTFVMPNPWDVGSLRVLESLGFPALATTSSGHAYTLGKPDGVRAVSRGEALDHASRLCATTSLPINGDLERGYGDDAATVADTIRLAAAAGLAGCSIEDATGDPDSPIYEMGHATERIAAAVEAARSIPGDFVLTARAENFLHGRPDMDDTIRRLQAFQEAGADVLYAPGVADIAMMRRIVESVDRPVNALARRHWTVAELAGIGVKRVSIGGSLMVAALATLQRHAAEIADDGTFTFIDEIPESFDADELFGGS